MKVHIHLTIFFFLAYGPYSMDCQTMGDCTATEMRKIGELIVGDCVKENFDFKFNDIFRMVSEHGIITDYCKKFVVLFECFDNAFKTIGSCLGNELKNSMAHFVKGSTQGIEYLCANDASRILEFIDNQGITCLMTIQNDIRKCSTNNSLVSKFMVTDQWHLESSNEICSEMEPLKMCILNPMLKNANNCPQKIVDILKSTMEIIQKSSDCEMQKNSDNGANSAKCDFFIISSFLLITYKFIF